MHGVYENIAENDERTYHQASHNVSPSKTIGNFHLVFLGRTYILDAYDTSKLFPSWEGDAVHDSNRKNSLQGRKPSYASKNHRVWSGRAWSRPFDLQCLIVTAIDQEEARSVRSDIPESRESECTNRSRVRGYANQTGPHGAIPRVDATANLRYGSTRQRNWLSWQYDVGRHMREQRANRRQARKKMARWSTPRSPECDARFGVCVCLRAPTGPCRVPLFCHCQLSQHSLSTTSTMASSLARGVFARRAYTRSFIASCLLMAARAIQGSTSRPPDMLSKSSLCPR